MIESKIAIIGGSGVYSLFASNKVNSLNVSTPFGDVILFESEFENKSVYFLPRHGSKHSIPPHLINFKANIYALFKSGVKFIIATNAVGSLKKNIKPGEFVVLDQFIDLVSGPHTFFDGEFEIELNGNKINGVKHTDVTEPYSAIIRESIFNSFKEFPNEVMHKSGCYVMFNGPRFETRAEIKMFQQFGDVVGMTGAIEIVLARELNIDYASINLVTNFGAGIQKEVNHEEVIELFESKIEIFKKILLKTIETL